MLELLILYQIMIRVASLPNWCHTVWTICFICSLIHIIFKLIEIGMKLKE